MYDCFLKVTNHSFCKQLISNLSPQITLKRQATWVLSPSKVAYEKMSVTLKVLCVMVIVNAAKLPVIYSSYWYPILATDTLS